MTIQVEVFSSPGCGKCGHAKEELRLIAEELGEDKIKWRTVNILEEIDHAVSLGVLSTPAIAINGELIFNSLPSKKKLRSTLESKINQE